MYMGSASEDAVRQYMSFEQVCISLFDFCVI